MDDLLVPVFQTSDQAVLPLATMALDDEHIEYTVWRPMGLGTAARLVSDTPFVDAGIVTEIRVRSADEARARDVLRDLQQALDSPEGVEFQVEDGGRE